MCGDSRWDVDHIVIMILSFFSYILGGIVLLCVSCHVISCKWECFCDCRRLKKLKAQKVANAAILRTKNANLRPASRASADALSTTHEPSDALAKTPSRFTSVPLSSSEGKECMRENSLKIESIVYPCEIETSSKLFPKHSPLNDFDMLQRRQENVLAWEDARRGLVECKRKFAASTPCSSSPTISV